VKIQSDAESTPPRRSSSPDALGKPLIKTVERRFRWRAVIHSGRKVDSTSGQPTVAWHLAECDDPQRTEAHCEIGRRLIALDGNPDGHCYVGGACLRCPEEAEANEAPPATAEPPEAPAASEPAEPSLSS
jgi:hypothetical protein